MDNTINIQDAKIAKIASILKVNTRSEIEKEVQALKNYIDCYFTVLISYRPEQVALGELYVVEEIRMPILRKFFETIKKYSEDAYKNATDGKDILNIEEEVCKNQAFNEAFNLLTFYKRYVEYLAFYLPRLCDENDEFKVKCLLKGMILI